MFLHDVSAKEKLLTKRKFGSEFSNWQT